MAVSIVASGAPDERLVRNQSVLGLLLPVPTRPRTIATRAYFARVRSNQLLPPLRDWDASRRSPRNPPALRRAATRTWGNRQRAGKTACRLLRHAEQRGARRTTRSSDSHSSPSRNSPEPTRLLRLHRMDTSPS